MRCPGCSQLLSADASTCPVCGSPVSSEPIPSLPQPSQQRFSTIFHGQARHNLLWRTLLITLLVGLLVLVGVRVMLTRAVTHTTVPNQTSAAMQLYHQVLSQPPDTQYSLTAPSHDWKLAENVDGKCTMESDGLHVQNSSPGSFLNCPNIARYFTAFALQVDMRVLSGGGGLTCRETPFGEYEFLLNLNGTYNIGMQRAAQSIGFQSGRTPAMNNKAGATNTLTLIARGSDMYFYVNQTFVTLLQDATFPLGNVSVVANTDTGPAEAVYTNAKLWDLSK